MKLVPKLDPETKQPVWNDKGQVIYIDQDDGDKEYPLDPVGLYSKVSALGAENQKHREKNKELSTLYEPMSGIEDIADWKQKADAAMAQVQNFSEKDRLAAEEVQKLKDSMTSAYEEKLRAKDTAITEMKADYDKKLEGKDLQVRGLLISSKFASSKYFGPEGVTNLLPDVAESFFGRHFKVEIGDDGKPTERGFFDNGDPVLSKVNPGQPADFEEAIGLIVDAYPNRDSILRSKGGGSGGKGGDGDGGSGSSDLASLEKQLAKANEEGNSQAVISLTNSIHQERIRLQAGGA